MQVPHGYHHGHDKTIGGYSHMWGHQEPTVTSFGLLCPQYCPHWGHLGGWLHGGGGLATLWSCFSALGGRHWSRRVWAGGGTAASSGGIPSTHGDPHCSIHGQPPGNKRGLTSTAGCSELAQGSPPIDNVVSSLVEVDVTSRFSLLS
jgi:hypothetical protein